MILDKYRLKKEQGTLSLKRVGYDVILTRDGEGVPDKKITSEQVQSQANSLSAHMNALKEDHKDLLEAIKDIKKQEALVL